ncbi:MAG: NAD-dependent epimerase/dehydratase family protein [Opitutaceae bacterium]|jgi:CDP-paratose 2-epimerase
MRILISGVCGFVGTTLARALVHEGTGAKLHGFDSFVRPGSETNRTELRRLGVKLLHADLRAPSDLDGLPPCDWVIDAAANPSVLAGVDGRTSSRQVLEHNLLGTLNLLEYCKEHRCGLILLSTSRVYSIASLASLPLEVAGDAFRLADSSAKGFKPFPQGLTREGIAEDFPTEAPVSLYGATKLASEALALEYGEAFGVPVFVNRCGVLAGAGQFGRADQGIFAYWLNRWLRRQPLAYLGFGGHGHQVRDCLHPRDLLPLIRRQMEAPKTAVGDRTINLSGGGASAMSLRQLSDWCAKRWGGHAVASDPSPRPFDLPWVVLDSAKAARLWKWRPQTPAPAILEEIAVHAEAHPDWLEISSPQ